MFKPHYGICILCNHKRVIVVKKGWCKACNQKQKPAKEARALLQTQTTKHLVAELDRAFSIYIRTREAVPNGITRCVTCGKTDNWKYMDCGHYHSRRYFATRWEPKNCGVQCKGCNIFHEGNKPQFTLYLINKYGLPILDLLLIKKNNTFKLERFNLKILISFYNNLNKKNGFT